MPQKTIPTKPERKILRLTLDIPPSVNHCYAPNYLPNQRTRRLTAEARSWKEYARIKAMADARRQGWQTPAKGVKVVVELVAYWPDGRTRDMHNAHKLLMDALEDAGIYQNDKYALARDMDFFIDRQKPRLEVFVYLKPEGEAYGQPGD